MRFIDADALKEIMCMDCDNKHLCAESPACDTVREIDSMPTIEAEPVKHGRWINYGKRKVNTVVAELKCSECDSVLYWAANYCPNCGARMGGGEDGR